MKICKLGAAFIAAAVMSGITTPVMAQESRYDLGNIWYVSGIDVLDGQFEKWPLDKRHKAVHVAKVEGDQPAVMFIEADGPWDVVMEK